MVAVAAFDLCCCDSLQWPRRHKDKMHVKDVVAIKKVFAMMDGQPESAAKIESLYTDALNGAAEHSSERLCNCCYHCC